MTDARRIAVTGLGAVSALGAGVGETWDAVREGRGGIALRTFDPGQHGPGPVTLPAALVADGFQSALEARMGRKISGSLDRFALMALCPAFEALDQAGLIG